VVLLLLKNVSDAFSRRGVGGKKENQKKKEKKRNPSNTCFKQPSEGGVVCKVVREGEWVWSAREGRNHSSDSHFKRGRGVVVALGK
jgi:purine nucleoside phosphorylase